MGLAISALCFLAREHRRRPFSGSILTLGRQGVLATLDDARRIIRAEGLTPAKLPPAFPTLTTIPQWQHGALRRTISDAAFFRLLGLSDTQALDVSDYERAEIIHDLNRPVPPALHGRFSLIIDGGTLEHVFDVRQALTNIALMLAPGGRVIHISPANNYTNHGFYQLSPTLYFDYYAANRFSDLRGFIAEQDTYLYDRRPWELFELSAEAGRLTSPNPLMLLFIAEKTAASTADAVPTQAFYTQTFRRSSGERVSRSASAQLKAMLPLGLKIALARMLPFLDPLRRPWGLRRLRRLG
jgi:SAM-dependent methyltransferase